ncbi:MAG: cation diffusion facilitator family transporter [Ignavibacteria bacterium]|nr:cation diffusion facilitator family transporter [Ignavibacteria bacterium]
MKEKVQRASRFALGANVLLFIIKLIAGIVTNSIAIISEAINSFTDILTSIVINFSVKLSHEKEDDHHQYGHHAAQPIAAMILAIFAGVVGVTIIKESIGRIIEPKIEDVLTFPIVVLLFTICLKSFMALYFSRVAKKYDSPAVRASSVDSRNDVLSSSVALVGIVISGLSLKYFDGIAGIILSFFILKGGYEVAKENIDYLMGKAADKELMLEIANKALKVNGVKGLNDLKSHYIGNKYHIEIHIEVDQNHSTKVSHDIGVDVKRTIKEIPLVAEVFVHIDPV